ncbi:MAG TPA: hypothetical protein VGA20_09385 [Gemmatimonadales bacterium]
MAVAVGEDTARLGWLDGLRGAAVLLMLADHMLALASPAHVLRFTLTRLSLPAFMVAAGAGLAARGRLPSDRRVVQCGAAAAVATGASWWLGFALPEAVTLYLLTLPLAWALRRAWPEAVVLGLVQALSLPVPWGGYQPGLVLAYLALGIGAAGSLGAARWRWPGWVQTVGRRPLAWYAGHLAVLAMVAGAA